MNFVYRPFDWVSKEKRSMGNCWDFWRESRPPNPFSTAIWSADHRKSSKFMPSCSCVAASADSWWCSIFLTPSKTLTSQYRILNSNIFISRKCNSNLYLDIVPGRVKAYPSKFHFSSPWIPKLESIFTFLHKLRFGSTSLWN